MIRKQKSILSKVVLMVIAVFLIIVMSILQSQINELKEERDELQKVVKQYSDIVEELNYDRELSTKDYIEKYAREELGFHKSGEIVFKNSNGN